MNRVFWDTMLFSYHFAGHPLYAQRVREWLQRSQLRGDTLLTSHLVVGEVMAGAKGDLVKAQRMRQAITDMGFRLVAFDEACIDQFERLRAVHLLGAQDSMHLSAAAQSGVDVFLTYDNKLLKRNLYIQGVRFIVDFTGPIL